MIQNEIPKCSVESRDLKINVRLSKLFEILKIFENSRLRKMAFWGDTLMMFRFVIRIIP